MVYFVISLLVSLFRSLCLYCRYVLRSVFIYSFRYFFGSPVRFFFSYVFLRRVCM